MNLALIEMAQSIGAGFTLEQMIQLTGMSSIAGILLWNTLVKSKEQDRCFRGLSVTMITLQQCLLVYTMASRKMGDSDAVECQKLHDAYAEIKRLLEQQRQDLERNYAGKN